MFDNGSFRSPQGAARLRSDFREQGGLAMRVWAVVAAVALLLPAACGGGGSQEGARGAPGTDAAASGADAASGAGAASARCLPVARCQMFNGCATVHADGKVDLPPDARPQWGSLAMVERRCPGDPGVDASLTACLDFVETQVSCTYRPTLAPPPYACGFVNGQCRRLDR